MEGNAVMEAPAGNGTAHLRPDDPDAQHDRSRWLPLLTDRYATLNLA